MLASSGQSSWMTQCTSGISEQQKKLNFQKYNKNVSSDCEAKSPNFAIVKLEKEMSIFGYNGTTISY